MRFSVTQGGYIKSTSNDPNPLPCPLPKGEGVVCTMPVGFRAAFFTFLPFYLFTFMGGEGVVCP